ncbi:ATP-binding cassette domain-containing protein [Methanopyrus sp.]
MPSAVVVEGLRKVYETETRGEVVALDGFDMEVEEGEIHGVLGRSGAGKSTLIRILRGVERFDEGRVEVCGVELTPDSPKSRFTEVKRITAIHPQREFGLWPETAAENVMRKLYWKRRGAEELPPEDSSEYEELYEEALEYLRIVGLEHKADHYAPVLSGGEKQRLLLARQLAKDPEVLLLDEPAAMACPGTKQQLLDAVRNANEEKGITVIVVSHLTEVIEYLCDSATLLEDGRDVLHGDPHKAVDRLTRGMPEPERVPDPRDEVAVRVEDLEKRYALVRCGETLHMRGIDLEVKRGEILAVVGPSGAGKTVLLRMIAGLELPDSGDIRVRVDGDWVSMTDLGHGRMEARRRIGIVHQEFGYVHHATVRDLLAGRLGVKSSTVLEQAKRRAEELGLGEEALDVLYALTDLPREEAEAKLRELDLDPDVLDELFPKFPPDEVEKFARPVFKEFDLPMEILDMKFGELSGGQRVRVAIALELATEPEVLLLDEPFGDLDPVTLRNVANSIKRTVDREKIATILVSHDVRFVEETANRAVLIDDGEIVMEGNPKEVCREFVERSEAKFLEW